MKYKNRGFTLIELLAVIVVLAIIMVIAGASIVRVINKSRVDSFVSSYNMVIKAIHKRIELGGADITALTCDDTATCASIYDLDISPEEYDLKVAKYNNDLIVKMSGTSGGKFEDIKLTTSDVEDSFTLYDKNGIGTENNSIGTRINVNSGNITKNEDSNDDKIKGINRVMKNVVDTQAECIKRCPLSEENKKSLGIPSTSNNIEYFKSFYSNIFCNDGYISIGLNIASNASYFDNLKYNFNMNNNYRYGGHTSGSYAIFTCIDSKGNISTDNIKQKITNYTILN